ncbi:TRAP transporter small permease [Shewanella litorisediminis]|uniref:TRAP transporter small permease protein n=1 Tax=Shewanella litorisediminis TaxID=1173586 RepID=A0ABX7FZN2_9GAMM|nr:TRAP transporter small permease [Shewanella litorisediminis]MCL2919594.1 TRAP transporter small permease [Shewanella litorisediminis]QRH00487.1 TRAP transporter small permease [Shewanella litorisediminis]
MISRIFGYFEEGVLNLLITLMTLLVFMEVIARFFFNTGFLWIQELTLTICGWFVLFGMSYGIKVGAHIGVDAFVKKLKPGARRISALLAVSICLIYCAMFLKGTWDYLSQIYHIGIGMEDLDVPSVLMNQMSEDFAWEVMRIDPEDPAIPLWISQSILILGFMMLTWRFLELAAAIFRGTSNGFSFHDEAKESMHLADEQSGANDKNNDGAKS